MDAEQMKQHAPTVSLTCQHPVLTPGCDVLVDEVGTPTSELEAA